MKIERDIVRNGRSSVEPQHQRQDPKEEIREREIEKQEKRKLSFFFQERERERVSVGFCGGEEEGDV